MAILLSNLVIFAEPHRGQTGLSCPLRIKCSLGVWQASQSNSYKGIGYSSGFRDLGYGSIYGTGVVTFAGTGLSNSMIAVSAELTASHHPAAINFGRFADGGSPSLDGHNRSSSDEAR
jgi:hypothetical protein